MLLSAIDRCCRRQCERKGSLHVLRTGSGLTGAALAVSCVAAAAASGVACRGRCAALKIGRTCDGGAESRAAACLSLAWALQTAATVAWLVHLAALRAARRFCAHELHGDGDAQQQTLDEHGKPPHHPRVPFGLAAAAAFLAAAGLALAAHAVVLSDAAITAKQQRQQQQQSGGDDPEGGGDGAPAAVVTAWPAAVQMMPVHVAPAAATPNPLAQPLQPQPQAVLPPLAAAVNVTPLVPSYGRANGSAVWPAEEAHADGGAAAAAPGAYVRLP